MRTNPTRLKVSKEVADRLKEQNDQLSSLLGSMGAGGMDVSSQDTAQVRPPVGPVKKP